MTKEEPEIEFKGFLVVYSRRTGEWAMQVFEGPRATHHGLMRRLELDDLREDRDIEIVVLGAQSFATVNRTHSRYFTGRRVEIADLTRV